MEFGAHDDKNYGESQQWYGGAAGGSDQRGIQAVLENWGECERYDRPKKGDIGS